MKKKLLFVASSRSHILHFHLPYLRAFQESGWSVHCACGGTGEIPHADKVLTVPFEKKMSSPRNFRAARMLKEAMAEQGYDAVLVHTSLAAFFTRLALLGVKDRPRVINMVHGYLFDDRTPPLKQAVLLAAERLTAPVTDLLLTMNQWDYATACRHRLGKRIANVPGVGVDYARLEQQKSGDAQALRQSLGISPAQFALLYPAEFSARKSQQVLLRAMKELPENAVLVLPGDGALLPECKALADTLGLSDRVIFPGYVSQMGLWYEMADCAVSASRSEGLPFNIMEAMHSGLPIVASSVKGHTDLLRHGGNGLLYAYGDHEACAAQIRRLMEDRALAQALGRQAKEDCAQYALEQVFPQVMAQYDLEKTAAFASVP